MPCRQSISIKYPNSEYPITTEQTQYTALYECFLFLYSTESLTLNVSACAGITLLFSISYQLSDDREDAWNSE